jgi:hypothetical protein
MALGGLVSATFLGETYLHKSSNLRLCSLKSREHVNRGMLGVAQPVMGCKAVI